MIAKPALTPSFCLHVVINSTPKPGNFHSDSDPSVVTLFDLGVIDAMTSAFFTQAVKSRIFPWHLNDSDLPNTPDTTLQTAADAVQTNAF